jgi:AraC-like DNA-binding protein
MATSSELLVRKQLLQAIQREMLPAVMAKTYPRVMLTQFPLRLPVGVSVRELPVAPLPDHGIPSAPEKPHWPDVGLLATEYPQLGCVLEGEADIRFGVTVGMSTALKKQPNFNANCGAYVVSMPKNTFFITPAGIPRSDGSLSHWERPDPEQAHAIIFWAVILPIGVLCHTCQMKGLEHESNYSLLVENRHASVIVELLMAEMRKPEPNQQIVQTQMTLFLLYLQQGMEQGGLPMINGLYERFLIPAQPGNSSTPVLKQVRDYIRLHLHEQLRVDGIAQAVELSPSGLKRLFRNEMGTSVMQYVTGQRLEAAKRLLRSSDLSIDEISHLVGYTYCSRFSQAFQDHEGISPLKFRQRIRRQERPGTTPAISLLQEQPR